MPDYDDDNEETFGPPQSMKLDTSLAEVKTDKYLAVIKAARYEKVREKETLDTKERMVVEGVVDHGPYSGLKFKDWIGLDMANRFAAKKLKNFCESLIGEKLSDDLEINWEEDDNGKYQMVGAVDSEVGVWLKQTDEGFINVDFKGYVPAWDPNATDDEEPF
jgi:hypothetical protein